VISITTLIGGFIGWIIHPKSRLFGLTMF